MPGPVVSVVIPVYNRRAVVTKAVASVLEQTFQAFEVLVVDDASTDGTAEVVASIADARITIIRHEQRRGGSAARNTGIRASRAPFVAFLDSDDEWLPDKLERQLEVFDRSPQNVALVYSGAECAYADGSVKVRLPRAYPDIVRASFVENVIGDTSLGMVRRTALLELGGFDESLPAAQEMDLWVRICERFGVAFVPAALARVSKGSDPGRITADTGATTRARELFRAKHRSKMLSYGVLHLNLRESGWCYLREARDPVQARRCYREALAAKPTAPATYFLLALTYLPQSWLDSLAALKRIAVDVVRRPEEGSRPPAAKELGSVISTAPKDARRA